MAHPYHHAVSSAKKWGGEPQDYQAIHDWFDATKAITADVRHRALRHHAEGIFLAEEIFGTTITISTGREIPVRWLGEQHVREDLGRIPPRSIGCCASSRRAGWRATRCRWRASKRPSVAGLGPPLTGSNARQARGWPDR